MQLDKLLNSCPTVDNEVKNQIQASSIEFENNQKESKNSNRPKEEEKKKPRKMSIPYIIPMPPPESFDSLPLEEAINMSIRLMMKALEVYLSSVLLLEDFSGAIKRSIFECVRIHSVEAHFVWLTI